MDASVVISQFVAFINNSYDGIFKLVHYHVYDKHNIILADKIENGFYQFIWEMVVETQLCFEGEYLEPYGDGADFYGKSSRVVYSEKEANAKIVVNVNSGFDYFSKEKDTFENLELLKFVSFDGSHYFDRKPFDFVLCEDYSGRRFLFKLNEARFFYLKLSATEIKS
jgi:hypothetical protein